MTLIYQTEILGVKVDFATIDELMAWVENKLRTKKTYQIVTLNPEMVMLSRSNRQFRDVVNSADLRISDGVGLQMAAEFLNKPMHNVPVIREFNLILEGIKVGFKGIANRKKFSVIPERIAGVDLFLKLLQEGEKKKWRFFLLGGKDGVANIASDLIKSKWPKVEIVGAENGGIINKEGVGIEDERIIAKINRSNAQFLLVCFGVPTQELWINRNKNRLETVRIAIGGGGALDFVSMKQKRAPKFFQQHSLEWLWRLITMPNRWIRILTAFLLFPLYVAVNKYRMIKSN